MSAALVIIALTALGALGLGLRAAHGREMTLEQWCVGGRGFGAIFVFLLMAGEIYTTFTFLGGSGYAYGKGGPAYYILGYGCLAYILSYWLLPAIWRYGRENRLLSQSDFFVRKYESPTLGIIVSLVGLVALIPYLVLQFRGLGIIVTAASYGGVSSASRQTFMTGNAVLKAADQLIVEMKRLASPLLGLPPQMLEVRDGRIIEVGSRDDCAAWGAHESDDRFADRVLIPGLIESHAHLMEGFLWAEAEYVGAVDRYDPSGKRRAGLRSIADVVAHLKVIELTITDASRCWAGASIRRSTNRARRSRVMISTRSRPRGRSFC